LHKKEKASTALRPFKLYPQILENIIVKKKKPLKDIEGLDKLLKELDGKSIRHLVRYSGTENKLRILLEGQDNKELKKEMEKLVEFFKDALNG
jgi:phosphoglucosamine mutase